MDFLRQRFLNDFFIEILEENNFKLISYLIKEKINFNCLCYTKNLKMFPDNKILNNNNIILIEFNNYSFFRLKLDNKNFTFETFVNDELGNVLFTLPLKSIFKITVEDTILSQNSLNIENNNSIFIKNKLT